MEIYVIKIDDDMTVAILNRDVQSMDDISPQSPLLHIERGSGYKSLV